MLGLVDVVQALSVFVVLSQPGLTVGTRVELSRPLVSVSRISTAA